MHPALGYPKPTLTNERVKKATVNGSHSPRLSNSASHDQYLIHPLWQVPSSSPNFKLAYGENAKQAKVMDNPKKKKKKENVMNCGGEKADKLMFVWT